MKSDPAHVATDAEIAKIEKLITKEYKKAHKEVSQKLDDYLARFAAKDEKWQEWVANGTKTKKEYKEWRKGQILVGKRWQDMRDSLATDYTNAAKITQSITKSFAPEVYAINHNYATFQVEKNALVDTSYSLYSRESVEYMYKGKPKLYHTYGKAVAKEIKEGKQHAWDKRRITSVLTQAILQGESIPAITKRLEHVTAGDHKAAIRNARTMMTGVQNAGRIDAFERAKNKGIPVRKQWLATLDSRTRHWHKELDGVIVDNDEPFENEFGKIMFPGDPEAAPANVYNCRCTLLASIKGFEIDTSNTDLRHDEHLGGLTYEEWLAEKKSTSNPIDLPEQKAANIKGAWWGKYGGGAAKQTKYTAAEGQKIIDQFDQEAKDKLQAQYDKLAQKEYSDIWQGKTVTVADYADMETPIKVKHYYLDNKIKDATAKNDSKALAKYNAQKKSLDDFEKQGKKLEELDLKLHPEKAATKAQTSAKVQSVAKTQKTAQKANPAPVKAPAPKEVTEKEATKAVKDAQDKVDALTQKQYVNIWKDPVTTKDYPDKKGAISAKKKYFEDELDKAKTNGWTSKEAKFTQLLDDLADFEKQGKAYEAAKTELDEAKKVLKPFEDAKKAKEKAKIDAAKKELKAVGDKQYDLWFANIDKGKTVSDLTDADVKKLKSFKKAYGSTPAFKDEIDTIDKVFDDLKAQKKLQRKVDTLEGTSSAANDMYSAERKAKAMWARTAQEYKEVDKYYEITAKKVHGSKTAFEHEGYYHYTWGSGPFNQPLAGFKGSWSPSAFVGPGKLDINVGGYGSKIRGLTQLCSKSKYDRDFWVQSGQSQATLEGFLKVPYGSLRNLSDAELQKYVGVTQELPQFISGAVNKGGGSYTPGDMLFNIYCPSGSEALYVRSDGYFKKNEHEMILQRGGTYRISRIYWGRDEVHGGRKLIVDLELRLEKGYNKFQQ